MFPLATMQNYRHVRTRCNVQRPNEVYQHPARPNPSHGLSMSEAKATLLPCGSANKPYRWTRLDGRQTTWTPQLVTRLAVLWSAGYHHETISDVLDVGPRAASSKASRIGLPARGTLLPLSRDMEAARRLDALEQSAPKALKLKSGQMVIGRPCSLSGIWFYGLRGTHTSPEAKLTECYRENFDV